jgi:ABC-2 type transport system permease protein
MNKILRIVREEYRRHVIRKQFIGVLLFPLIVLAIATVIGFITVTSLAGDGARVVGYFDPANTLAAAQPADSPVGIKRFDSEAAARAALQREEIGVAYIVSADFASSGAVQQLYWKNEPQRDAERAFERFARTALVSSLEPRVRTRMLDGAAFTYETPDRSRSFGKNNIATFVLPIVVGVLVIIGLSFGAQYLVQAVVDEKENRTMEVLITAVTPFQLMAGKIVGLTAVVLTQIGTWTLGGFAAFSVLRDRFPFLGDVSLEPAFLLTMFVLFVFQFLLYAAVMAAIGSAVTDTKQAQQWATPFTLLAISPEFFLPALFIDPNGIIAVALTLIPFTAPFTLAFRYGMTSIPFWQLGLAMLLMALSALAAIWAASKIFRVGLLSYGKSVPFTELFDALRM